MPARHLTDYLPALRAAAPNLVLDLWETHCEELTDALIAGEIDIAIMSASDYDQRIRAIPLYSEFMTSPSRRVTALNR